MKSQRSSSRILTGFLHHRFKGGSVVGQDCNPGLPSVFMLSHQERSLEQRQELPLSECRNFGMLRITAEKSDTTTVLHLQGRIVVGVEEKSLRKAVISQTEASAIVL